MTDDTLSDLLEALRIEQAEWHRRPVTIGRNLAVSPSEIRVHGVIEGTTSLVSEGRQLRLQPGDIAILRPGASYRLCLPRPVPAARAETGRALRVVSEAAGERPLLMFTGRLRLALLRGAALLRVLPELIVLRNEDGQIPAWVRKLGDIVGREADPARPGAKAVRQRAAELFVIQAIREELAGMAEPAGAFEALPSYPQVVKAVGMIRRQIASPWSLTILARAVGMSRSAFAAAFSRAVGEPPMHFLARMRVETAAHILRTTPLSIGEVAACTGYGSDQALARAFKHHTGQSPGEYRRLRQLEGLASSVGPLHPGTLAETVLAAGEGPPRPRPGRRRASLV